MLYIVPGFLFVTVFNFFTATKVNGLFLWVESAAISFVSLSFLRMVSHGRCTEWTLATLSCFSCILTAVCTGLVFRSEWFKNVCGRFFRITRSNSVLSDAVNWRTGTVAVVRLKTTREIYSGRVRTISHQDDPEQWICLDSPSKYDENYKLLWPAHPETANKERIAFHLDDIDVIRLI